MGRYRSRSRSYSPRRSKRYDDPRESRSRRRRRSPAPSGLLVRNISVHARPEDIRIPFERFGPLKDVYLPKDYHTGEPRGFGFVKYQNPEDAADAKERLNHTVIGGREIQIVFAEENRKTPHEMRRMSRISESGSYRRQSPTRSPRRRYHSYSRSPSPSRSGFRERRTRDDHYYPSRSRSVSRSVSPRDERSYRLNQKSPRRSGCISRSLSPRDKRNYSSPSPREIGRSSNDDTDHEPSRSPSPRGNSRHRTNYHSRSYSPR